jgi:alkylhydroperoxidase/carboxymuconolactone decarboxylase family protein YurZ
MTFSLRKNQHFLPSPTARRPSGIDEAQRRPKAPPISPPAEEYPMARARPRVGDRPEAGDTEHRAASQETFRKIMGREAAPPETPYKIAALDTLFGDIWARPGLTRKERRLISLACAGAAGATSGMEAHTRAAVGSGDLTRQELQEFLLHFAFYQGFPKASAYNVIFEKVFAEVDAAGRKGG